MPSKKDIPTTASKPPNSQNPTRTQPSRLAKQPSTSTNSNPNPSPATSTSTSLITTLRALPEIRPIPWRPGTQPQDHWVPSIHQTRGILLSARGKPAAHPCERCAAGEGVFAECIVLGGWYQEQCGNCLYKAGGRRCSLWRRFKGRAKREREELWERTIEEFRKTNRTRREAKEFLREMEMGMGEVGPSRDVGDGDGMTGMKRSRRKRPKKSAASSSREESQQDEELRQPPEELHADRSSWSEIPPVWDGSCMIPSQGFVGWNPGLANLAMGSFGLSPAFAGFGQCYETVDPNCVNMDQNSFGLGHGGYEVMGYAGEYTWNDESYAQGYVQNGLENGSSYVPNELDYAQNESSYTCNDSSYMQNDSNLDQSSSQNQAISGSDQVYPPVVISPSSLNQYPENPNSRSSSLNDVYPPIAISPSSLQQPSPTTIRRRSRLSEVYPSTAMSRLSLGQPSSTSNQASSSVNSSLARLKRTSLDGNRRSSMSRSSKTNKQSSDSQQSATSAKPEGETPKISMLPYSSQNSSRQYLSHLSNAQPS